MGNFHVKVEQLRSIFKCNNYRINIIDQCIKKFLDKLYVPKQIVPTAPKKELLIVLPFFGKCSLNFRIGLYKSVSKTLPKCNKKVIFQSKNQLSNLFKFKESTAFYLRSHLIYKFQCSNCNINYYGETELHLKVRAGGHISVSSITRERVITNKNLPLKIAAFCQVKCVPLMILPSWIMSHTSLNAWKESLYSFPLLNKQVKSLKLELFQFNSFYTLWLYLRLIIP